MMQTDADLRVLWARLVVLLIAAGYLLAVRRRSPQASWIGLGACGLMALWVIEGMGWIVLFGPSWFHVGHYIAAHALLVWAVLADRQPATHDQE